VSLGSSRLGGVGDGCYGNRNDRNGHDSRGDGGDGGDR
jgi:hypothetical protein